jgi:hypothetical protein
MTSILAISLLLLLGGRAPEALPRDPVDVADWSEVWAALLRLEELVAAGEVTGEVTSEEPSEEHDALRARLAETAREQEATPRGELLARHLARLTGKFPSTPPRFLEGAEWPFRGRETWLAAEVIPPGPDRVRCVLRAIEEEAVDLDRRYLLCAWGTAVEEARALRLREGALPLQERLHAHFQAPWTARDLSLTHLLLGAQKEADALLAATIAQEGPRNPSVVELWSQRGIGALAVGDERRARDYFGWALGRGSTNAAVVLARIDLDAGRLHAARSGFRALLWDESPGAWALRGWGLSLLPSSQPRSIANERSPDPNER